MKATKEQIIAEATRRAAAQGYGENEKPVNHFIIDVVVEGWTPPEPVDPDVLAFREWQKDCWPSPSNIEELDAGKRDGSTQALAYLAGARMAREQEQERAKVLVEYVEFHTNWTNAYLPVGATTAAQTALAKYRGEV